MELEHVIHQRIEKKSAESTPEPAVPPASGLSGPSPVQLLLTFLQTSDAYCPVCRYNLRHLTLARCPECGRELHLTVGTVEPYVLPWVFATTFVAMAASVGIVVALGVVFAGPPLQALERLGLRELAIIVGSAYGVMAMPLTLLLLVARRRYWRMRPRVQVGIAVAAFAVNAVLLLAGFAMLS